MINQPMGRVTKLEYRDVQPKMAADTSVLAVHFRAPDSEVYEHPLQNPQYSIRNKALQLMALHNFKPSDIEGTSMNIEDWQWLVPLVADGDEYALAATVLEGGAQALKDAEWFATEDEEKDDSTNAGGPHGGGGPDPSTGNRGGVDHEEDDGGVEGHMTPDENTGVNIHVS